jgi:hypothetical protein
MAPEPKEPPLTPTLTDFHLSQNYFNVYLIMPRSDADARAITISNSE